MKLTETQSAYLAGLIDGEGSLECQKQMQRGGKTHRYALRISFVFATEEPLRTVCEWLGTEMKMYPAVDDKRSPRYRGHIPKAIAVSVLTQCLPYLLLKRRQAELILQIEAVRESRSPSRHHFGQTHAHSMPAGCNRTNGTPSLRTSQPEVQQAQDVIAARRVVTHVCTLSLSTSASFDSASP